MKTLSTWILDGTFRSAPEPFALIFKCMAASETGGQGIAVGFLWLPNNRSQTSPNITRMQQFGNSWANIVFSLFPIRMHVFSNLFINCIGYAMSKKIRLLHNENILPDIRDIIDEG